MIIKLNALNTLAMCDTKMAKMYVIYYFIFHV